MADASFIQSSFAGGEVSKSIQGRVDRPDYRTFLNVCLNGMPVEQGAWQRRTGTRHAGPTRGGVAGRVISFDFKQAAPYNVEFTDGHLRFWNATQLVTTNDDVTITSISTASPAVVLTSSAVTWVTGDQAIFKLLGSTCPLLQNRVFALTKVNTTHFSIADAITGTAIDGSTLGVGSLASGAKIARVLDITSPYIGGDWVDTLLVPTDIPTAQGTTPGAVLLNGSIAPYVLQVATEPTSSVFATFTLAAANLKDGPYLDPVPGGTLATPSALIGNITVTLSFNAYDATRSYAIGDYVTSSSVNYKSLTDANLGNTPASSATNWVAVSAADAIGTNGFQGSDVGRMVRLLSAPALWASGTAYTAGQTVAYGTPETYWVALTSTTGNIPGTDLSHWAVATNAFRWTWGKITGLSNIIDRALASSANIGDMTSGGGNAAAFDGNFTQTLAVGAYKTTSGVAPPVGTVVTLSSYVGKDYHSASAQKIQQSIVYPSSDFGAWAVTGTRGSAGAFLTYGLDYTVSVTYNLRAKASAPANSADGTLLGTSGAAINFTTQQTITSSDQTTTWNYVWIEQVTTVTFVSSVTDYNIFNGIAEVSFFNPTGSGTSQGFTLQILGDPLLNTVAIRTWRLGRFSNTTGWPTNGTFHEGRLFLAGVTDNHWDASKSNDPFNFAPTNPNGSIGDNNAISYTFNAPDVNPIFGMMPEQQGIVMTTQAGEWLVQATTQSLVLTPTSIQAHRYTKNGCADIEPVRTDHTIIVVQRFRRKILEFFPDVISGKYSAQNILMKNEPLSKPFIAEIRYQQELVPVIWARMDDGTLIGITYSRTSLNSAQEPAIAAPHRHTLGSGRLVESITVGPSVDGNLDALAIVTNDATTGLRHVEVMTTAWEEGDALASAWFLDDAIVPSSTATTNASSAGAPYGGMTLYGLWHLNGATATVFAGGLDCGEFAVSAGSCFVPYGDSISAGTGSGLFTAGFAGAAAAAGTIVVGFTYTSDGQIVRAHTPQESGARNGPAFAKTRRSARYAVQVYDTAGLSVGTTFAKLNPVLFKNVVGQAMGVNATFTGIYRESLDDDYSFDSMLCWRITRPLPANLAAAGQFPHTQDV